MSEDEEGLCNNCGVFGKLFEGGLCEDCYEDSIEKQNDYAYGEGEEEGVSLKDQHIDDYVPFRRSLEYALEKIIPYDYNGEPVTCTVCMEQIKNGDTVVNLPCFHQFHGKCIYKWLQNNENCPVCRTTLYKK
jgi:hypothetical protein